MNGARDEYLDALAYKVKEEVIRNYLRERRILEEEINEYRWTVDEHDEAARAAAELRGHLACLLVSPGNFRAFWKKLGFDRPPLARLDHGSAQGGSAACPLGLTPKGFTKRGKYVNIVMGTYALFREQAEKGRLAAEKVFSLAQEINEDIRKFHLNHDIMSIVQFLRSMDLEMIDRKKVMGDNFSAAEVNELSSSMTFKRLRPRNDGVRAWPELPDRRAAEDRAAGFLREVFQRERENVLPAIR